MSHDPAFSAQPFAAARRDGSAPAGEPAAAPSGKPGSDAAPPPTPPDGVGAASRRRRMAAALITPAILLVATLGGHAAWSWHAERRLARYVDALSARGEPVSLAEVLGPPVADRDNGAIDLRDAGESIDVERWSEFFNLTGVALPLTEQELDVIRPTLEGNRAVMERVRVAMRKPSIEWTGVLPTQVRTGPPPWWGGRGQGFFRQRSVAQLIYAAALVAHQDGDDRAAFDRIDELMFLADAACRRFSVRAQSGSGVHRQYEAAFMALAEVLPELSVGGGPDQVPVDRVRAMLARLVDEQGSRDAILRCLRAERARYIDYLMLDRANRPAANAALLETPWSEPLPMPLPPTGVARAVARPAFLVRAEQALDRLEAGMESLAAADLADFLVAFPIDPVPTDGRDDEQFGHGGDEDSLRMLTSAVQQLGRAHYLGLARRRTTAAAVAIALYRAEHGGRLPAKGLPDLVPAYLPAVPSDPLSISGDPLVFIPDADRPRVYSVGEDGIDDGGSPPEPFTLRTEDLRIADWVIDLVRQPRSRQIPRG